MWLTTADAAKMLGLTTNGVRWLVRDQQLTCEYAASGQRLFRRSEVWRCVLKRADARAQHRAAQLAAVRPRMVYAAFEPRQMSLFGGRLRIVRRSERPLQEAEVKAPRSFENAHESEKPRYVNQRAAGGRR